jgi:hypothetical protein
MTMGTRNAVLQYDVLLDVNTLDDQGLHALAGDIGGASTTSTLVLDYPTMQASVAAISDKDVALARATRQVEAARNAVRLCLATEALARAELRREIRTFAALATRHARSSAEIWEAGLRGQPAPGSTWVPVPPPSIVEKAPRKGRGKTTVIAEDPGPNRHDFDAEQSTNGERWKRLGNGHGKTRVVTGPSGAQVYVRFATVRWGRRSAWSAPLLVKIP